MSTIGDKIDQLQQLREQKRGLEGSVKKVTDTIALLELKLIEQMDSEGITKSTGKKATVSISESIKPSVEDWDVFYEYIRKNRFFHLLERRPAVLGCRELFETRGKIPGVVPFTQRKLNIRSTK